MKQGRDQCREQKRAEESRREQKRAEPVSGAGIEGQE